MSALIATVAGSAAWMAFGGRSRATSIVAVGKRAAVVRPIDERAHSPAERRLLETIRSELAARMSRLPGASVRTAMFDADDADSASVARAMNVTCVVEVDLHETADRSRASLLISPGSHDLPAHREQFDVAGAVRAKLVDELIAHAIDDLRVLLDERRTTEMRKWGTQNVHAYRDAREPTASRECESSSR